MQAIILAAGKGTRLGKLSQNIPKPLIKVGPKKLIEHSLSNLPQEVDEVIIVVGYMKNKIIAHLGNDFENRKITYIEQKELLGTGHAVNLCQRLIKDQFIVMMGDDIYSTKDMARCIQHKNCILVKKIKGKTTAAKVVVNDKNELEDIIENTEEENVLINTGFYVLSPEFFGYDLVPIKDGKEFGLPQTIVKMSNDHKVVIEQATSWLHVNTEEELKEARKAFGD